MAKKRESMFYQIIKNTVEDCGGFYSKIPDTFPSPRADGKRFIPKKPFDIFFVFEGKSVFIEVKYAPELKAFSTQQQLSEYQKESLQLIHDNANESIFSIVVLGIFVPRKIKRVYIFDYEWLKNNPQKKKDLLLEKKYIDIKRGIFKIDEFFNNIIK